MIHSQGYVAVRLALAEFLKAFNAATDSFWYSVLGADAESLCYQTNLDEAEYFAALRVSGLVTVTAYRGEVRKKVGRDAWKYFFAEHHVDAEIDVTTIRGNTSSVLRIGQKYTTFPLSAGQQYKVQAQQRKQKEKVLAPNRRLRLNRAWRGLSTSLSEHVSKEVVEYCTLPLKSQNK